MKLQTFFQIGKKHENSDLDLLPAKLTGNFFQVSTSIKIIVQSALNESAEQEKQFDIPLVGGYIFTV